MISRPRRNRKSNTIRALISETTLTPSKLVYPLFLKVGKSVRESVISMPGVFRFSIDEAIKEMKSCSEIGISSFALFPYLNEELKDARATYSLNDDGLIPRAVREMKSALPEACLITDVAMDPYSSDGHDGLVQGGKILNDESLEILAGMAIAQARAGADIVAPSDMMDGRIGYLRERLDGEGFSEVSILSYCAKYASSFYGPFRDALGSAPKQGDKKTYQMDFSNRREALREAALDETEGADFLMVKPALSYLDVILSLKQNSNLPICAYQVSGEYSQIKLASAAGICDEKKAMIETLTSIHRAGADFIFTYFAKSFAESFNR